MSLPVVWVASCCLVLSGSIAFGQKRDDLPPKIAAPAKLEPYSDVLLVVKNARRAIHLLGLAQLSLDPYPEPNPTPIAGVRGPKKVGPECDSEQTRSFNRGYLLAHVGFNLFLSLQELDVPRVDGPHGLPNARKRNFVQFGRSALVSVWTTSRLRELLEVRHALKELPAPVRQDLSAFLSKLREYRQHYLRLRKARAEVLADLFMREDDAYFWYEAALERYRSEPRQAPKALGYDELSELLDDQLRQVSDLAKTDPDRCYVEHYGPIITFPSEKLEYTRTRIYPTKYLVSFWHRREMEGTGNLADYVITRVFEVLRGT